MRANYIWTCEGHFHLLIGEEVQPNACLLLIATTDISSSFGVLLSRQDERDKLSNLVHTLKSAFST